MTAKASAPLVIHGWSVYAHPLFIAHLEQLVGKVQALRSKDPKGYTRKNASKQLAAIAKLAFDVIPQDPARPEYRQGGTLGEHHKHWFRAKFLQQYRLFFRYHSAARVLVLAWMNDEDSKRAYESDTDAYRVFRKMLEARCPPDDWDSLLAEAKGDAARLLRLADPLTQNRSNRK